MLMEQLQSRFVRQLEVDAAHPFDRVEWLRDGGLHGGGHRYVQAETELCNRAAVNVSGVHYDDEPNKRLRSADALSTIIHPRHPLAPSIHMHVSWTEMRDDSGYFRIMADLNPAIENVRATEKFRDALREAAPEQYLEAEAQGDRYFRIPALDRHRGVSHFYLEAFSTGDFEADTVLARRVIEAAMDAYVAIVRDVLENAGPPTSKQEHAQLAYHTAYLFQVLTLDRGTTSGLLVHDQNDQGIMGSLPSYVDRALLASWAAKVEAPQDTLVHALVAALEDDSPSHVNASVRIALAQAVRTHYQKYPEALAMQASGAVIPPTVANHE